jgi:hypothetical protein
VHRRRSRRYTWIGGTFLDKFIIKKSWQRACRLRLRSYALLYLACILIDKAEQDMFTPNALGEMANTWMFGLHPGVDNSLKRGHAISTLCAIKAFEPVHLHILSDKSRIAALLLHIYNSFLYID